MPTSAYRTSLRIVDANGNLVGILPETISAQILDFAAAVRAQIAPVRGTASALTTANAVLEDGRLGIETDTGKLKIGNGSTSWTSLPYFSSGSGGGATPDRRTAAQFTSADPILADGVLGIETDTGSIKIGDGTTAWTSLPYAINKTTEVVFELST